MADPINAADGDELRAELARRDEEILRLRDLLIGRDAELGAALGRLEILEQGSRRITEAAGRVPIPGATRAINALLIFLQGRRG
jgi:hypothetical protein